MIRPKDPPLISGTQFVAIVVLTIAIFLIIDFGRRTTTGYYIAQAEEQLKAEIEVELTLQAQLKERRDYVLSPEYVEKWARDAPAEPPPGGCGPMPSSAREAVPDPIDGRRLSEPWRQEHAPALLHIPGTVR